MSCISTFCSRRVCNPNSAAHPGLTPTRFVSVSATTRARTRTVNLTSRLFLQKRTSQTRGALNERLEQSERGPENKKVAARKKTEAGRKKKCFGSVRAMTKDLASNFAIQYLVPDSVLFTRDGEPRRKLLRTPYTLHTVCGVIASTAGCAHATLKYTGRHISSACMPTPRKISVLYLFLLIHYCGISPGGGTYPLPYQPLPAYECASKKSVKTVKQSSKSVSNETDTGRGPLTKRALRRWRTTQQAKNKNKKRTMVATTKPTPSSPPPLPHCGEPPDTP